MCNSNAYNKKHLKNVGPIRHCKPFYIAIHQVSLLSHAACASMSTTTTTAMTTTTTTTRDRGDRYGPIEWAQSADCQTVPICVPMCTYVCQCVCVRRGRVFSEPAACSVQSRRRLSQHTWQLSMYLSCRLHWRRSSLHRYTLTTFSIVEYLMDCDRPEDVTTCTVSQPVSHSRCRVVKIPADALHTCCQ